MKTTNFFTKIFCFLAILAASTLVLTSCNGDDHDPNNNGGNGGNLSPTTDPGVVINGIRWATRNVDRPGTFAANPEDAGMFYRWNRRVGWSSTNPLVNSNGETTWDSSFPRGTTWYSENCPCPPDWRVPTREELTSLINSGSTWVTNWNDTGVNGRVFGTSPNQIFLPAVGWRVSVNGVLNDAGTNGFYWSSTFFDVNNARFLWFNSDAVNAGNSAGSRPSGMSVRCITDN